MSWFTILIFGFASVGGVAKNEVKYSHLELPLHGTIYHGMLYGFFGKSKDDFGLDAVSIEKPAKSRSKIYQTHWMDQVLPHNYRHHINKDSLWISTAWVSVSRLKLEELELFDSSNNGVFP